VFENVIAPRDGPPFHTHAGEDESWYVLEGELRFRLGTTSRARQRAPSCSCRGGRRTAFRTSGRSPRGSS
jgi:uncharacterized cupin superfamily protein